MMTLGIAHHISRFGTQTPIPAPAINCTALSRLGATARMAGMHDEATYHLRMTVIFVGILVGIPLGLLFLFLAWAYLVPTFY